MRRFFIFSFVSVLCAALPARADFIEFTFAGIVDQAVTTPIEPWGTVAAGAPFSVRYVFDTQTPDLDPADPTHARYLGVQEFYFTLGGVTQRLSNPYINLVDCPNCIAKSGYIAFGETLEGVQAGIQLISVPRMFTSDALPEVLYPQDWGIARGIVSTADFLTTLASGRITGFEQRVVPEPATAGLLLFGLIAIGVRRSTRRNDLT